MRGDGRGRGIIRRGASGAAQGRGSRNRGPPLVVIFSAIAVGFVVAIYSLKVPQASQKGAEEVSVPAAAVLGQQQATALADGRGRAGAQEGDGAGPREGPIHGPDPYALKNVDWWWGPSFGDLQSNWDAPGMVNHEDGAAQMALEEKRILQKQQVEAGGGGQQRTALRGGQAGRRQLRFLSDALANDPFPGVRSRGQARAGAGASGARAEQSTESGGDGDVDNESAGGDAGGTAVMAAPRRAVAHPKQWLRLKHRLGVGEQYMHMAMAANLGGGDVAAAWQASSLKEGSPDQHIRVAFGTCCSQPGEVGGGAQVVWGEAAEAVLVLEGQGPAWGPVLHWEARAGRLWLFYSQSRIECHTPGGDIKVVTSTDRGATWSAPRVLYSMADDGWIGKVVANSMQVVGDERWVLPVWREKASCDGPAHKPEHNSLGVLVSGDEGATWQPRGSLTHRHTWMIEASVVDIAISPAPPRPVLFARTTSGHLFSIRAKRGKFPDEWEPPTSVATLPNADTKAAVLRLSGRLKARTASGGEKLVAPLVAVNNFHAAKGLCHKCRTNLSVAVSSDEGVTWKVLLPLEEKVAPGLRLHYPTVVELTGGGEGESEPPPAGCWRVLVVYSVFYMPGHEPSGGAQGGAAGDGEGIQSVVVDICP